MATMKRTSFTLPPDLDNDLTYVARRLGVSRSSLVAEMLRNTLGAMTPVLREVPEDPSEGDALRYRGESKRLIDERLAIAQRLRDDLFVEPSLHGDGHD